MYANQALVAYHDTDNQTNSGHPCAKCLLTYPYTVLSILLRGGYTFSLPLSASEPRR